MPGLLAGHKRRAAVMSDDEDGEESLDDYPSQSVASSAKRTRVNGPIDEDDGPLLPNSYRASQADGLNASTPTVLKHQPGSIVRVTLKNFVTYTNAEFLPGPSLNMVIGANGTGKSTLVCAICLGLGWKTEHLGRAKNIGEFVKHGSREAEIEIELAADPQRHDSNPVVKHQIKKENDKSAFFINGRQVPRKQVLELCRSFSIQVDNLCQFLPQDRVVEFAALSPVDLLEQTQRAAAPDEMVKWHDELKSMRSDQKKSQNDQQTLSDGLKNLEGRQNLQRTDVERLKERNDIQERLRALEKLRPMPAYRIARTTWQTIRREKREAEQELTQLREEVEPSLHAANEKKSYGDKIAEVVDGRKRLHDRAAKRAGDVLKKQEQLNDAIREANTEAEAERKTLKNCRTERARHEAQVRNLQVTQEQRPPDFDAADYNERLRDFARQKRELEDKAHELNNQQKDCVDQIRSRNTRKGQLERDIQDLNSQAGQQNNKLKQASQDTWTAWQRIMENKERFRAEVYGPPIVSCTVKDQKHAAYVENMMGNADMLALTVTDEDDFEELNRYVFQELGLKDVNIRNCPSESSQFQPPVAANELRNLGLDAYVLDLLDGPAPVLRMLCDNRSIHATGVAFRDLNSQQYEALLRTQINSFATPKETFMVTRRREYGDAGTSTRTRRLRDARFFSEQAVDAGAEREIRANITEIEHEMRELVQQVNRHKEATKSLGEEQREIVEQTRTLQGEKDAKQKALSDFNALPVKIQNAQAKVDQCDEKEKASRAQTKNIQDRIDALIIERGQEALNYAVSVDTLQKLYADVLEAELLLIEAQSDHETLHARNAEVNQRLQQREAEVQTLTGEVERKKQTAQRCLQELNDMIASRTEREEEIHGEQPDGQTPEELNNEIETMQARLEMVHEGNPNILREFEERGQKIARMQQKLDGIERDLTRLQDNITATRAQWEPKLDTLVAKISAAFGDNFARIGCAGQVEVHKDEDFENWSIQVMVKFREHESLSVLDSHRQSGGERAVSTIFYLMALQSLARAPFRVVDEINQGMDPRNERLVHSRIVNIACAEHTSQYFLITPKLLPNLTYHPNMKVHCIASGEYMPGESGKLDFQKLAATALGVKSRMAGIAV